ncbi:MAG TPA: hypothetical protein GXX30_07690 [Firmicutes bacterium]|nr:hypothetical protein [Candidatus Fermentithermobacillaceae bacterium]
MAAFYALVALIASKSWLHVIELIRADWPWLLAVSVGFGVQVGMFISIRRRIRAARAAALANAGTGVSAVTMIACCLHHFGDVLPVIGLAGTAAFLSNYKYPLLGAGMVANIAGIIMMFNSLRRLTR